jgi:hypothetical protein
MDEIGLIAARIVVLGLKVQATLLSPLWKALASSIDSTLRFAMKLASAF